MIRFTGLAALAMAGWLSCALSPAVLAQHENIQSLALHPVPAAISTASLCRMMAGPPWLNV